MKAKPVLYATIYEPLKVIAQEYGWLLLIHGSLNRDLDLVLVPWIDKYRPAESVIEAFAGYLAGEIVMQSEKGRDVKLKERHGSGLNRRSAIINLNRDGRYYEQGDEQWYLDIAVFG